MADLLNTSCNAGYYCQNYRQYLDWTVMVLKIEHFHIGNVIYLNYLKLTGLHKSLLFCALFLSVAQ